MNDATPSQTFARLCDTATPEILRRHLLRTFADDRGSFPTIYVYSYFITSATPLWGPLPDPCEGASNEIASSVLKIIAETAKKRSMSHGVVFRPRFVDEPDRPELLRIDVFTSDEPRHDNPEKVVFVRALDERYAGSEFDEDFGDPFVYHKFWSCVKVRRTDANGELDYVGAPDKIQYPF